MQPLSSQRGLSLIELMIGILLSSLLLLGVLQIFDSNRDTIRMQLASTRVQESGRFAVDLLSREIRMADYWGCAPDKASIQDHLDQSDDDYLAAIHGKYGGNGIRGEDNATGRTEAGKNVVDGTDVLTLGGAENACGGLGRMMEPDPGSAAMYVSPNCALDPGRVVLISNCKAGELLTVTDVQGGQAGGADKQTIVHSSGVDGHAGEDEGWVKNIQNAPSLQESYGTDATILTPYFRTYFVAESDVAGTTSLFMSEDGGPPQELVPGIEDMQVRYGRDTTGNGMVDTWQDASNSEAQMEQVTVIRVKLLVASDGNAGVDSQDIPDLDGDGAGQTFTDGHLRKLYTVTAKVRNRGSM